LNRKERFLSPDKQSHSFKESIRKSYSPEEPIGGKLLTQITNRKELFIQSPNEKEIPISRTNRRELFTSIVFQY